MASQTIFGTLNTWGDGDNPGAGAQDRDSNGLNGNWWKIMSFIWHLFNAPAVSLRDAIIGGRNLKSDVADATTIEQDGASKKLKVKDGGITNTQIASTVADAATIEKDGSTGKLKVKNAGITATQLAASAVVAGKIADDAVVAGNIAASAVDSTAIEGGAVGPTKLATNAVETAKIANANVTTEKLEYKEFVCTVSQSGTSNPVGTTIKNTIGGTPTWTRLATPGLYKLAFGSAILTLSKTVVLIGIGDGGGKVLVSYQMDNSNVFFNTVNSTWAYTDSLLAETSIIIRVYP